jgi:hypothetical protein
MVQSEAHQGTKDMFRRPLARDIAWISIAKLVVLVLIYALFFSPVQHSPEDTMRHIAETFPLNAR